VGDDRLTDRAGAGLPRGFWVLCAGVFLIGVGVRLVVDATGGSAGAPASAAAVVLDQLRATGEAARTVSVYGGLGTWVDAYDVSPSYSGEGSPPVAPTGVEDWAAVGVRTLYVQAARLDERSPGLLLEREVLAELLLRAHAADMLVVGWYLPTFADVDADLERLLAIAEFEAFGHRFDGVAVDIEHIEAVPDPDVRSARLLELSEALRAALPGEAIGAIVPPAAQLEVVNPSYWPSFPWQALGASYDVWLPMAYWTTRSGTRYGDPYVYTEESTRRMRANLGRADVVVHPVGGIGDRLGAGDLDAFARALADTGAIGGSIYDWASLPDDLRPRLAELVPS
jgi:hypothetical protein